MSKMRCLCVCVCVYVCVFLFVLGFFCKAWYVPEYCIYSVECLYIRLFRVVSGFTIGGPYGVPA